MKLEELYEIAELDNISVENFKLPQSKAMSLQFDDDSYFIGIDYDQINNTAEEKERLSHELGHCESGAFYMAKSKFETKGRCEARVFRWQLKKILPCEDIKKAFNKGYIESWELAEYFDLPEDFIRKAYNHYKSIGKI